MLPSSSVQGASVALREITRSYGEVHAVNGIDLDVAPGEFVTLLGPSGSGKTTTLNIIAGFESATSGEVLIDGRSISKVPTHKRDMGVVFQNYALFPHMTAAENVAFPLKERRIRGTALTERVKEALALVRLDGFRDRYPSQLSGGQQQRIALARAIVYSPKVLLMDEPLGALDKKLRTWLQDEIRRIHRELRTTVLFVTHDQEEALALSDRIALFREGRIVQIGTPEDLWNRPDTPFVADFLGESNLIVGTLQDHAIFSVGQEHLAVANSEGCAVGESHTLLVRPENVHVRHDDSERMQNRVAGTIAERTFMGSSLHLRIETSLGSLRALSSVNAIGGGEFSLGQRVWAGWHAEDARMLLGVDPSIPHSRAFGSRSDETRAEATTIRAQEGS